MEAQRVWILSEDEGWVSAIVKEDKGDTYSVHNEFINEEEIVKKKDTVLLQEPSLRVLPDMISMSDLHEATILYNLRERYKEDQIYTYIGPMVVSVNPFKELPIYGSELIPQYQNKAKEELPPHLFAIAQKAWISLRQLGQSQSVVISGESGAGKTEATKVVLKFLTYVASQSSKGQTSDLASRILATNPVLEAFGNAKTVRNNNSSRFGKFIKIAFDYETGQILGARIDNYLLEQTRVVGQAPNERCYHIFYQLINGSTPEEKEKYHLLNSADDYKFLSNGNMKVNGIDDKEDWKKMKNAMFTLGITQEEQDSYFSILSGILRLGNIEFSGGEDQAEITNLQELEYVSKLLQVYPGLMKSTLTSRLIKVLRGGGRQSVTKKPLNMDEAVENRNALAKAIYSRLFDYLVQQLNKHLQIGEFPQKSKFIGVLDIYGFEKFRVNSLEQFCINYANEKLHQQFNEHMFKAEQQEYTKEGVEWTEINFNDNKPTIELIERVSGGLLAMLDEECKMPKGSDKTLLEKIRIKHKLCREMNFNPKLPDEFTILHYAEPVSYLVEGFLDKNRDNLSSDVVDLMAGSSLSLLKELFYEGSPEQPNQSEEDNSLSRAKSRARAGPASNNTKGPQTAKTTVTKKFSMSLNDLVTTLANSHRHYVRCIKPNDKSTSELFIGSKVLTQLRSNGVLETVKLRKAGYANRMLLEHFFDRYRVLGLKAPTPKKS